MSYLYTGDYSSTGNMEDYDNFDDKIESLEKGEWYHKGEVIDVTTMEKAHVGRAIAWCRSKGYDDTLAYEGLKKEYRNRCILVQESGDSFGNQ